MYKRSKMDKMMDTAPTSNWIVRAMEKGRFLETFRTYDPCYTVYKWGDDKAEVSSKFYICVTPHGRGQHYGLKLYNVKPMDDLTWEFDHSVTWLFGPTDFEQAEAESHEVSIIVDCFNALQPWKDLEPPVEEDQWDGKVRSPEEPAEKDIA